MTSGPYTQLARHLHALGMGYPLKDDLVDILRANSTEMALMGARRQ